MVKRRYSYKKNKVLKYKKRIFKTNKKTKYGAYGYDARGKARFLEDKKTFMDVIKSYTKRNGIVKVKNGISVDLVYKNKKLTQVMLVS